MVQVNVLTGGDRLTASRHASLWLRGGTGEGVVRGFEDGQGHTAVFKMDNQQAAVRDTELCSALW